MGLSGKKRPVCTGQMPGLWHEAMYVQHIIVSYGHEKENIENYYHSTCSDIFFLYSVGRNKNAERAKG